MRKHLIVILLMGTLGCMAQSSYDYFFMEAMVQRQKGNSSAAFDLLRHCLQLNPQAPEAYYYLAQYYAGLKDQERALAYMEQAARLSPDNPIFLETLAQGYIRQQQFDKATEAIERLYAHNKDRDDLLETLYQLYQEQKQYDRAISVLSKMEEINGKSEQLSYAKSNIYTQMGDSRSAIAEMAALARQYPNDLNYLGRYADMLLMNNQERRAVELYHRILAEEPDNVRAQASMMTYYRTQNDTVEADRMMDRILMNRNATSGQKAYLLRQKINENEETGGDSTEVLALFHRMLDVPEPDADIASLLAAYMDLKQMPQDSINPVLETILSLAPDNAAARLQLVASAWSAKDMDRVISLCREARLYNPEEMPFYYYQGMAYFQKEEPDEALNAFQNGIGVITDESNPEIVSDFYAILGDLLHQKGREQEAFAAYDSCLQWKPNHAMTLNNYAYFLCERGERLDDAEQMSRKSIELEPGNANSLDTYAWIMFQQKRYAEAKIYIDQALQNDSTGSAVVLEHAGDIYSMNHDTGRALELWREALGKEPDKKTLIRKIKLKKYVQ